mgnify:CR=1 FL=1
MEPETIARFADRALPRYTSYPTAPNFSAAVGEADYRAWLAALDPADALSLYLHVPFCRAMCWYCGCHTTVTARETPVTRYVEALASEIGLVAAAVPARMRVSNLHFGGGSPTLMRPDQLAALTALLLALSEGGTRHAWDSSYILGLLGIDVRKDHHGRVSAQLQRDPLHLPGRLPRFDELTAHL